jgi:aryl-alcohol dehydrogenase-like predicted oxidoreductase
MEYRLFGKSGLKVSALGYGCMTFGDPSNGNVRLLNSARAASSSRR